MPTAFSSMDSMKEPLKKLERAGDILKSVSTILSGVSSFLPWIKKLIVIVRELLQHYHWKHRLAKQGGVFL